MNEAAEAILRFWLSETPPEKRFVRDEALDRAIGERFGHLIQPVAASEARDWRGTPHHLLAAIILLDQFPRNLFRGEPRAFAHDRLARSLAKDALVRGWDEGLSPVERQFLYMPLMHSENLHDQEHSVRLYEALGLEDAARFARLHHDQIARFGRFPGRNEALGRESSAEELAFLEQPGSRF